MPDIRQFEDRDRFLEKLVEIYNERNAEWHEQRNLSDEEYHRLQADDELVSNYTHITVWKLDLVRGGYEEGGWWVTTGQVETSIRIHGRQELREFAKVVYDQLYPIVEGTRSYRSAAPGTDYRVDLTVGMGSDFPEVFPHYE